ncbi:MarR family winged helix-turn-helix transcriptional regulator [Shewanella intestini]|uniref:Winged helix-turn-helix transcriptional regulator n=1 Tax=Shewanella intestini TaxID=2017544 RepID=A0ABS5I4Y6_9GAMM|nr:MULTISPECIES: MarR family winged helix-turn-helix transcriptional regulator [Shewanella]MBR9729092.1 winged helix-turn-helix transcriptional regulator [Shewanella intestini]MRG37168.1 MarR family transcriptional regulator [Shewanella sp. XMDDZSB0408]
MSKELLSTSIFKLFDAYRHNMRKAMKANELGICSMHVQCILYIKQHQACTANDIVKHLARDKAQIARLIKEMIEKTWLVKQINPNDKRSQQLLLTEKGHALADSIQQTQHQVHQQMQNQLNTEDLIEFQRIANLLTKNLQP